jgi:Cation transporter/ATPase, N-terminus
MDEKAIWALLRTSPEGLDPAEAEARLAPVGPNLVTRKGRPSVLRELWVPVPQPIGLNWRGDAIGELGGALQGRDRGSFRSTEPLLHGR